MVQSPRLGAQSQDEGFHEIRLNGKQLVFLFMAATVVSVVIFLCGVLVGRGVRVERGAVAETSVATAGTDATTPQVTSAPAQAPAGADPTTAPPPPETNDLTYFNRLEKEKTPPEQLKPAPAPTTSSEKPEPASTRGSAPVATATRSHDTPPASGAWTVQIAALNERNAADTIAKRLSAKGYPAYVFEPTDGTSVFRVRVGHFPSRHDAESLKTRLERDEQFKPFVTR